MKKLLIAFLPVLAATFTACPSTNPDPTPQVLPTITFSSDLEQLPAGGGDVTLSWTVANATSASIDGGVGSVKMAGSKKMKLSSSKTYTLTAKGSSGSNSESISIEVAPTVTPPVVTPPVKTPRVSENLIQNPGAEASIGSDDGFYSYSIPKWIRDTSTGFAAIVKYGANSSFYGNDFLSLSDPGPSDRGDNFFAGGYNYSYYATTIRQRILLDKDWIDAAENDNTQFELEGWFGGSLSENDNAYLTVQFLDVNGNKLGFASTSTIYASDRNNKTGLVRRIAKGNLSQGTNSVQVELRMSNYGYLYSYNDGYADNLSFKLKEKK